MISVRTIDPARKEARIRATRERIEGGEAASAAGGAASAHCSWSTRGAQVGIEFVIGRRNGNQDLDEEG